MYSSPNKTSQRSRPVIVALSILMSISVGISIAIASGLPPVAVNDTIVVTSGGTATTLADGSRSVLDNDSDAENDILSVVLTRKARRGKLTLNKDGTFVYRHDGGRSDSDEFRYRAFDGSGYSGEAKVLISVGTVGSTAPQITGQFSVAVNEDSSLSIDIRSLQVVDADSNFPRDFSLEVGDGNNYTRAGTTITPAPNFNGTLSVPVRVFDGTAFSNWYSLVVDVAPRNDPPFAVGGPPDQEAVANSPYEISLAKYFDDIDENDSFQFSAQGLPGSRSLAINPVTGVLSGTPVNNDTRAAGYDVTITATDTGGLKATINFHLTIYPDNRADLAVTATVSVNPVTVGESVQWNIAVDNLGPADLDSGELVARWSTSGPPLALNAPQDCTITANNTGDPSVRCPLIALVAGTRKSIVVQGTQNADGDNSLLAIAVSDDPITSNNAVMIGTQVVAGFSEGPTQILSGTGSDIASGDLNGDGLQDLVVTADQTVIFLNSGKRTFVTPGASLGAGSGGTAVVIADWNGDSLNDVAVAGLAGLAGRIYLNDGKGSFSPALDLKFANSGTILAAAGADFARDGYADLVLTGTGGSHLLRSTGQQGFSLTSLPAGPGIDVSIADINNDSLADILIVESGDRSVRLLKNSGDGRNFASQGLQRGSVAAVTGADLNGNGRVDLLLAIDGDDLSIPESRILYQRSDGTSPPARPSVRRLSAKCWLEMSMAICCRTSLP